MKKKELKNLARKIAEAEKIIQKNDDYFHNISHFCKKNMFDKFIIKRFLDYIRLEQSLSDNSVVAYQHDIELFKQFLESINTSISLKNIHQEEIESFLAYLYELGFSASSQARILSGLKKFFKL